MTFWKKEPHPPLTKDGRETLKPDRDDIIALILAGFQVIFPYVLFLLAGVVIAAVIFLNIWKWF